MPNFIVTYPAPHFRDRRRNHGSLSHRTTSLSALLGLALLMWQGCIGDAPGADFDITGGTAEDAGAPSDKDTVFTNLVTPVRGAFYYSWYPQTWTVKDKPIHFTPILGKYDSGDETVIARHLAMMDYAKINLAIASWSGIDRQQEKTRIPKLLRLSIDRQAKVRWAFLYEPEGRGNPSPGRIKDDLNYLARMYAGHKAVARYRGKPVIFVWTKNDDSCDVARRWSQAGVGDWFVHLKLSTGFASCPRQPNAWYQYGAYTPTMHHQGRYFTVAPGFWVAHEASPRLSRDINRFKANVAEMVRSREPWQLFVTFNEWGEGTALEAAAEWRSGSGFGQYLDALRNNGQ